VRFSVFANECCASAKQRNLRRGDVCIGH